MKHKPSRINSDNIELFRSIINNELSLLRNQLMNYRGKDLWSVVCSAMDWVETSTHWLSYRYAPELHNDPYCDSMNVIFYIAAVDMLYEGVSQLHRVVFGELCNKTNSKLLEDRKGIFSNIYCCKDDVSFFKQIRAIFGEHSVNLNLKELLYPPEERKKHDEERWFASWSYSATKGIPTEVFIYSNKPGVRAIPFSINLSEIELFAVETNSYILQIVDKARKIENNLKEKFKKEEWPSFKKDDYKKHIGFLLNENDRRIGSDRYRNLLYELRIILQSDLDNAIVKELKREAYEMLTELNWAIHSLQDLDEIVSTERLVIQQRLPYTVSKAYTSLVVNVVEKIEDMDYYIWKDELEAYVAPIVKIDDDMTIEDRYVIVTASLLRLEGRL